MARTFNATEQRPKKPRPGPGPRYEDEVSSVEYYTPPDLIAAIQRASGGFFLDPATPVEGPIPWINARHAFCPGDDDGLTLGWEGRVWLNPPYGEGTFPDWMTKFCDHGDGLALVFNRTAAAWYQDIVFPRADALRQLRGRVRFWVRKKGATLFGPEDPSSYEPAPSFAGAPSILIAMGEHNVRALEAVPGVTIDLRKVRSRVLCHGCGGEVPVDRWCYAQPRCHRCLPPPEPLPTVGEER